MQSNESRVKTVRTKPQESFQARSKDKKPNRSQSTKRFYLN